MSNTNLTQLDRTVRAAIDLEFGNPAAPETLAELGIAPQRLRVISGIEVVSNAKRDAAVDPAAESRLQRLQTFRGDEAALVAKLRAHDIEPLAVVPITAWDRLCTEAKLFRFVPKGDIVRVDPEQNNIVAGAQKLVDTTVVKRTVIAELTVIAAFIGTFGYFLMAGTAAISASSFTSAILNAVVVGLMTGLILVMYVIPGSALQRKWLDAHIRALVGHHAKAGTLPEQLWPEYHEPPLPAARKTRSKKLKTPIDTATQLTIALPVAPDDVQKRLVRSENLGLPLQLAVVGEAISFKEDVAEALIGNRAYWENYWRARSEAQNDPIVFVIHGTAVGVLAQYGDFPIEQEVVTKVVNSIHLA
jgi:hypothetical protein